MRYELCTFFCTIDIQFLLWVAACMELSSPPSKLQTCHCCTRFVIYMYIQIAEHYCVYLPTVHREYLPLTDLVVFFSRAVLLVSQGEQLGFLFHLIYCHLHDSG